MAQPLPNQPLLDVLRVSGLTLAEFDQMLRDGANEIDRLIPKLIEKHTAGGTIKAAQLALVRKELHVVQSALWGDLGRVLRGGVGQAVEAAAIGGLDVLGSVLGKHHVHLPGWRESLVAQAKAGIDAILAKAKNGIPLARSVYKTQALTTGMVDRKVSQGLLLGHNAKTIAKSVKDMIRPDVAGGVSYAAHRLARTEINHAYQTAQATRHQDEPWTKGMKWNLSRSHPKPDVCNINAEQDLYDLGEGVYPFGKKPDSHPNCLCYQTPEQIDEDEFEEAFLRGEYNSYIDEQLYKNAPREVKLPCR